MTHRILTDLHVPQAPEWAERVTLLPRPNAADRTGLGAVFALLRAARHHDVVITSNVRAALALGLIKFLTGRRRPGHVMVEMRLDDEGGLLWRLKVWLQRRAFSTVDIMCVSARQEIRLYQDRLGVPSERFRFVPWHTNVLEPQACPSPEGPIFAAGRTGRDWPALAGAAREVRARFRVVCTADSAARANFPDNVEVCTEVPYERYRSMLREARIVVIPLEPHAYSSGQVVILEAMALGKPVIATRVIGSEDYIQDGVNGMLVPPCDAEALGAAIQRVLDDPGLERDLAREALRTVLAIHSLAAYVRTITGIAEEVARAQAVP